MYLVLIQSVTAAVAGGRLRWQKIPRTGLFSAAPRTAPSADDATATAVAVSEVS